MHRLLRRTLFAGSAALAGAVLWGAQSASADGGGTDQADQSQEAVVDNSTTQDASAVVHSGQWNTAAPVTVGHGGKDHDHRALLNVGDGGGASGTTQSNSADNSATAGNANDTVQLVSQAQGASTIALHGSADGGSQAQAADVGNHTAQDAWAGIDNSQSKTAGGASVHGGTGPVNQSNEATNDAAAGNANITDQFVDQAQGSSTIAVGRSARGGDQTQHATVSNSTWQDAAAGVANDQSNTAGGATVGGSVGGTSQSNSADNSAKADNSNDTVQEVIQGQGASTIAFGGGGPTAAAAGGHKPPAGGAEQDQTADVTNRTGQAAGARVHNEQVNVAAPVAVGSAGAGTGVTQSNDASNTATAVNENVTDQFVEQSQAAGGGGGGQTQHANVSNSTWQSAHAGVANGQLNVFAPVAVHSPGAGSGPVSQSNSADNHAVAGNLNATSQGVVQDQGAGSGHGGSGGQTQHASLSNGTYQSAHADVHNGQGNIYAPVYVNSAGAGGPVSQSNSATNAALAGNANLTFQGADQAQAASGDGGGQTQSASLGNATGQSAGAGVHNGQWNIYAPVYVNSAGAGRGPVSQSNSATNAALAGNLNATFQGADQAQAANGQAGGQTQSASLSNRTLQRAASGVGNGQVNVFSPVIVGGGAGSGPVSQSNTVANRAASLNGNVTLQALIQAMGASVIRI